MLKITDSNVTIMVKDMEKAINFYLAIGLTLKQRWGDNYAMISAAGITLGLHPGGEKVETSSHVSVGFFIENIEDAKSVLEKNKIEYKVEADGKSGIYAHFKDLDGTVLYFVQPQW
jgi:predicted enzyme related to lactoylglutathione lyase